MDHNPIIVKFDGQKVISQPPSANGGYITIIENFGFDRDGNRWRLTTTDHTDERGTTWQRYGENFTRA